MSNRLKSQGKYGLGALIENQMRRRAAGLAGRLARAWATHPPCARGGAAGRAAPPGGRPAASAAAPGSEAIRPFRPGPGRRGGA